MQIIAHRINSIAALRATPVDLGVELDIRSDGDHLIIHHDPLAAGERFDDWIAAYNHKTLILNVKEEGLEDAVLRLVKQRGIEDFFFLDQSFPFLVRTAAGGERRCAVRVSEFESIDTALSLKGRIDWVWVDCFTRFPLGRDDSERLRAAGFRLCIVSPELQGRDAASEIPEMRTLLAARAIQPSAVCTKRPDLWSS